MSTHIHHVLNIEPYPDTLSRFNKDKHFFPELIKCEPELLLNNSIYHKNEWTYKLFIGPPVPSVLCRRQLLMYHLNSSGKYFAFKEQLKYAVVKIVREKYLKTVKFQDSDELKVNTIQAIKAPTKL